jgi:uncharacterized membrane protein
MDGEMMREHMYQYHDMIMQNHRMMHHGPGLFALLLIGVVWIAFIASGWWLFRRGAGGYKLFGLFLIGIGLLPLIKLFIPVLLLGLLVWFWKKGKAETQQRQWESIFSTATSATRANPLYDELDEWERKVRFNQNQTKGE